MQIGAVSAMHDVKLTSFSTYHQNRAALLTEIDDLRQLLLGGSSTRGIAYRTKRADERLISDERYGVINTCDVRLPVHMRALRGSYFGLHR